MALDPRKLDIIRDAIGDTSSTLWTDDNISDIYEALNGNVQYTIAHFLLTRAIDLTWPTAPTAPTLDDYPDTSLDLWRQHNADHIQLFTQQLALFREQESLAKTKADLYRAHAQIYVDAARNGEIL
jgi:hypothetical protein